MIKLVSPRVYLHVNMGFTFQCLKWRNKNKNDPKVITAKRNALEVQSFNPDHAESQISNDIQRKND